MTDIYEAESGYWYRWTNPVTGETRPHGPFDTREQAATDKAVMDHLATVPPEQTGPGTPDDRSRIQARLEAAELAAASTHDPELRAKLARAWHAGWIAGLHDGANPGPVTPSPFH